VPEFHMAVDLDREELEEADQAIRIMLAVVELINVVEGLRMVVDLVVRKEVLHMVVSTHTIVIEASKEHHKEEDIVARVSLQSEVSSFGDSIMIKQAIKFKEADLQMEVN